MIIFFKRDAGFAMPVALLDYTCSDDQYTTAEVLEKVQDAARDALDGNAVVNYPALSIFSLDYSIRYRHSAVNLPDALKTSVNISISNAPPELVSLLNLRQIVGSESALSLQNSVSKVVDAQNQFPVAVFYFDLPGPAGSAVTLSKKFMVYGTQFNFDSKRINSTLQVRGASYESKVMRLSLNLNVDQKTFLVDQIRTAFATTGYQVTPSDTGVATKTAVVSRYYPPAPINVILANVCRDNGLVFDLDETKKLIKIQSLDSANPPKSFVPKVFSFRGRPPSQYLISGFSVQDYATAQVRAELTAIDLFSSIDILNDTGEDPLFDNFRANPAEFANGLKTYPFYVMQYEYVRNRTESVVEILASNNWLLSNFRLDTLFENAVYQGAR